MNFPKIYDKALRLEFISLEEGLALYEHAPIHELVAVADNIRWKLHPKREVTWIIDRNVNITNICISGCKFCNFHCNVTDQGGYITTMEEYRKKVAEMFALGGEQLLLQGGMHPRLGLDFYKKLFSELKEEFPRLKLHALGPPEIVHLARKEKSSFREILGQLVASGLDSLPGAGAEILSDRVRRAISPGKCNSKDWLDVMREAHKMNLVTSATMMFGHIETSEERINHMVQIRQVQSERPEECSGFTAFIPWPFVDGGTVLANEGVHNHTTPLDYVRMIAISRIMLVNIPNIQASWLTVGKEAAQLCLYAGANDLGSIMIEENVVSSAGASNAMDSTGMQRTIKEAGFVARLRDQAYNLIEMPSNVVTL